MDLIERQAALDCFHAWIDKHGDIHEPDEMAEYRAIEALPSAQPETDSFCTDCKEYDQERHFCPRFDRVIKKTIEEMKAEPQWIPCSERLPEPRMAVLGYAPRYENIYALYYDSVLGWMIWNPVRDECFPNSQGEIVAWMPLQEMYKERREE